MTNNEMPIEDRAMELSAESQAAERAHERAGTHRCPQCGYQFSPGPDDWFETHMSQHNPGRRVCSGARTKAAHGRADCPGCGGSVHKTEDQLEEAR